MEQLVFGAQSGYRGESRDYRAPFLGDWVVLAVTVTLVLLSVVMIYSTTALVSLERSGDALMLVRRQAIAAVVGGVALLGMSYVPLDWFRRASPYLLVLAFILLVLTIVPGVGYRVGGASRWVGVGPFRFQPGELVKLLTVVYLAGYLERRELHLANFLDGVIKPFLLVGALAGIFLLQPDLGSCVILVLVTLAMILVAGARIQHLALCGSALALAFVGLVVSSPYRMKRILAFLDPWSDSGGKGYQLVQSLIAVGSGHVSGVGLGESQQKLFFLPAAHTDFIFAVIAEELGFLGAVAVLVLFLILLWRGLRVAGEVRDDVFALSLAVGSVSLICIPALVNMGVVLGLLPTKGLVLPLVGYGGTSLISALATIGILLAVTRHVHRNRR